MRLRHRVPPRQRRRQLEVVTHNDAREQHAQHVRGEEAAGARLRADAVRQVGRRRLHGRERGRGAPGLAHAVPATRRGGVSHVGVGQGRAEGEERRGAYRKASN